ncbi:latent-transforming growth factor beta-binding protein 4 isoform X4 [Gouania willdenowi]|uniref:latent-transforming growth factor beta-binding protein 4 isoform X4 n=1 Tax=Gouania willdenowi TaxID=441366 RepID=UPI001054DDFB|nr:latent-transforming growth factor beta-binding protein 4 isoform X4 [Gouania willdenowi]
MLLVLLLLLCSVQLLLSAEDRRSDAEGVGMKTWRRSKGVLTTGFYGNHHQANIVNNSISAMEAPPPQGRRRSDGHKMLTASVREVQALLLRKTLLQSGRGDKISALLMKHMEKEKKRSNLWSRVQIQVPSDRGWTTAAPPTVLCPLMCKNGGVCLQTDRCLCPPNYTGKFCHIPAQAPPSTPSTTNQEFSEFVLPLQQSRDTKASGPSTVKVRVQHPPEAHVNIHRVMKVSDQSPNLHTPPSPSSSSSSSSSSSAGSGILAQTIRGGGTYTQHSGFKYCFRDVRDGQCSSPLPGLRSREMCCKGIGKAWGITDCVLCADNTAQSNSSCPVGFEPSNGMQCVDINECLLSSRCENGLCVNTRGSFSCVCQSGFILDATRGVCVSQTVISEVKGQCHRILGAGSGPTSCSLPILKNITKQICCCSRVGKAWGADCQRCPYFGSASFKEICPAGPGYHYSASALQFNQRVSEHLGSRGAQLVTAAHRGNQNNQQNHHHNQDHFGNQGYHSNHPNHSSQSNHTDNYGSASEPKPSSGSSSSISSSSSSSSSSSAAFVPRQRNPSAGSSHSITTGTQNVRVNPQSRPGSDRSYPATSSSQGSASGPKPSSGSSSSNSSSSSASSSSTSSSATFVPRQRNPSAGSSHSVTMGTQNVRVNPQSRPGSDRSYPVTSSSQGTRTSITSSEQPTVSKDPAQPISSGGGTRLREAVQPPVSATTRPIRAQVRGVCTSRPGVCGRGRCVDQLGGKHTCVCDQGFKLNAQHTHCQDDDECVRSVCINAHCHNTLGSYRCVCHHGYRLNGTTCTDIDECLDPLQCPGQECVNSQGSYRCVSCRPGFGLLNRICTDIDECLDPLQCPGQECVNSQGSYRCVSCRPGFGLLNRICTDIDECRHSTCTNGHCENTPGSYSCICLHGYKLHNNTCADVDECADPSQCPGQMCVNSVGSYRCVSCQSGYTLINRRCTDVDECEDSTSCPGQQCTNTVGSYLCVGCSQGYHSVNGACTDIDECASVGACEAERVCVNVMGSFRCDCPSGFRTSGFGRQCRDINECLEGNFCFSRGECVNTHGSYTCVCSEGFRLSRNQTACEDVDECSKVGVCSDGRCVNTEGSFRCECETGFISNPERTTCLDVDECGSSGGSVCGTQRCENTIGSYRCLTSCEPGYHVTSGRCSDVDECATTPPACGSARCVNVPGSFLCVCDRDSHEYEPMRRECVRTRPLPERVQNPSSFFHTPGSPPLHPGSPPVHPASPHVHPASPHRPASPPLHPASPHHPAYSLLPPLRDCYFQLRDGVSCSLLASNSSQQECCCTVGEGWGLNCQYLTCPQMHTAEFLSLCPSGRGYVTEGGGAYSYRDVDECKLFQPEVCKNGVCVNNIPGYSCYCSTGFVYNSSLLECVDHDECEEESCVGGACINTAGSYYCSCPPPLVLDDTQRNCVNLSQLTVDENLSVCWQHVSADLLCQSPLLGAQVTFMDCCCLYGEGWGMDCALCPPTDSDDYARLCSSFPPAFTDPDPSRPEPGVRPGAPLFPPYGPPFFSPDYSDSFPAGGSRSGFRGRTPPDDAYGRPEFSIPYILPDVAPPPSVRRPATLLDEEEQDDGRSFPPYGHRSRAGAPRRAYERGFEPYAALNSEDCAILHGCENGRCIRVAEGYTCDCYQGYQLDVTSMTCIDVNECEDGVSVEFPCVNARCVNTDGSFRCVCRRGYVMSRRPNHCVAA